MNNFNVRECEKNEVQVSHLGTCLLAGSHCKIGNAAVEMVAGHATEDSLLLEDANAVFHQLAMSCPLLMFLWCYLLTLLNYSNHAFWARVLPSSIGVASRKDFLSPSINREFVRTGAVIVYSDFMVSYSLIALILSFETFLSFSLCIIYFSVKTQVNLSS